MNRRDVLRNLAVLGATASMKSLGGMDVLAQTVNTEKQGGLPDLVAIMGGEPAAMLQQALHEVGGIGAYVQRGHKVAINPNMGWSQKPELGANTNPDLIAELVRQCLSAGASEVSVFDHTCDEWTSSYKNSGIADAAKAAGAQVLPAHAESYYRKITLPVGKVLKEALVHQAILDSDVWFNVPVLKHHGGANLTIAMKNHMGIVWDRHFFHRHDLHQCIADICSLQKAPTLNIVDAYRVVKTNGPRARSLEDVVTPKALFLSSDIVAVDTVSTRFFNQIRSMPLEHIGHISKGQDLRLGTMDTEKLTIKRIKM